VRVIGERVETAGDRQQLVRLVRAGVESHLDQTYPKDVGPFDHEPVDALRILPTRTGPEIVGGFVLSGAEVAVAGAAAVGAATAVVVVVVTGLVSHHLTTPANGSPDVLLQSTPPVKAFQIVNLPYDP
jgi:hypothetical protein